MDAPPIQYVTTSDGYNIAYAVSGEGLPLVLLPNAWSHIQLFWRTPWRRSLFQALAERYRLVHFDARGQGLSTRGLGTDHTAESYVRDLDAVVGRLKLERFALLARNLFCQVAVLYALQHQEHVETLILSNPVKDLYEGFDDLRKQRWDIYTETIARLGNLPHDAGEIAAQFRQASNQDDHIKLVQALRWPDGPVQLGKVQTPTLVIDSATSPIHAHEWAAQLASALPQAQFVTLDDPLGGSGSFSSGSEAPPVVLTIEQFMRAGPAYLAGPSAPQPTSLAARETEVLRLLGAGKNNQEIAEQLVISRNTVRRHVSNIFDKTGVANRAQAAIYARDHGLD